MKIIISKQILEDFFDQKKYFYLVIMMFFSGCVIMNEPEVKIIGSVTFSHQSSKREIKFKSGELHPKSSNSSTILKHDSITQIKYSQSNNYKKLDGDYYLYAKLKLDTIILKDSDSTYVASKYYMSGNFTPPKNPIPNWRYEDMGINFGTDGFCVRTSVGNCSDSPCSTTTQVKGVYRADNDTIFVTEFMTRSFHHGLYPQKIKSIEEVSWKVFEPTAVRYALSATNDTLYAIMKTNYSKINYYLLESDSLIRTMTR